MAITWKQIYREGGEDIAIADGGTGQSTAQAAINALTAVAGATNEHVLTKDTATGNAIFKAGGAATDHGTLSGLLDDDHTQYALLAGRAGGQTLKGGTAVDDILKLQGTSGNGTAAEEAIQFLVGNNGGTIAGTILNNGNVGIGTTSPSYTLDLVATNGVMRFRSIATDATTKVGRLLVGHYTNAEEDVYVFGGASLVSTSFVAIGGGNASFNAVTQIDFFTAADNATLTGTSRMTIINDGKVGIGTTTPSQTLDLIGSLELENTTSTTTGVIYKGANRFIHNFTHPTGGTAKPQGANVFVGDSAGNFTMGSGASQVWHASYNMGVGTGACLSLTTGYSNMAIGTYALYYLTTGSRNVAIGHQAGAYIPGSGQNNTTYDSIYIGGNTIASADGVNNEIAIGVNVTGLGSNTIVLGNTSITKTILQGTVGIGVTSPNANAILDVVSTTKAFMPPRMTTTQMNAISSPTAGMVIYNTTSNTLYFYNGAAWGSITPI